MLKQSIERLTYLCDIMPPLLTAKGEEELSYKAGPTKWSKKQIIGHLIDSATNNHHRLIRGQFEHIPLISYDQDQWNEHGYYQQMGSSQLIAMWAVYNKQLLALIRLIPADKLKREVGVADKKEVTLDFIINDYVGHLEHHLRELVTY
jgi:DinB superfamily